MRQRVKRSSRNSLKVIDSFSWKVSWTLVFSSLESLDSKTVTTWCFNSSCSTERFQYVAVHPTTAAPFQSLPWTFPSFFDWIAIPIQDHVSIFGTLLFLMVLALLHSVEPFQEFLSCYWLSSANKHFTCISNNNSWASESVSVSVPRRDNLFWHSSTLFSKFFSIWNVLYSCSIIWIKSCWLTDMCHMIFLAF